jgi:ComF family protein
MLELFLPRRCIRCGDQAKASEQSLSRYLCSNCHREYNLLEPPDPAEIEDRWRKLSHLPYPTGIYAAFTFIPDGVLQSIVHHFKYADMPRLARRVGDEAATTFNQLANFVDVILPVPLHVTRYAERGYNQSELLAKSLSKAFGKQLIPKALKRIRPTPSQTGLSLAEREENVRGAFRLSTNYISKLKDKRLLVVDDVITTGATMGSIGLELAEAEPLQVGFFALAAAQFGT